ncbi:hypothetical protein BX661DRAFT_180357 [Kickxella alabastrina]|uniref:uncharacterized protein n=1 Tax=Kickxella alabastrina TaxID=61397 RepID=UPI0022212B08|nr:uncharacterized protein BX661DRAFT_180357 [Kickxella alabastrina]KAI7830945.1 hypothetical protein BX661DRAFT_180357 [Kickxella alabastrina]
MHWNTCLTCKRQPRRVFQKGDCRCPERTLNHKARDVRKAGSTDFRFRRLNSAENQGLVNLQQQMEEVSAPIEPNLIRANLCGTCQQRLRRAVEAGKEPQEDSKEIRSTDFRRHRSIRATIRSKNAKKGLGDPVFIVTPIATSTIQVPPAECITGVLATATTISTNGDILASNCISPLDSPPLESQEQSKYSKHHNSWSHWQQQSALVLPLVGARLPLADFQVPACNKISENTPPSSGISSGINSNMVTTPTHASVPNIYSLINVTVYDATQTRLFTEKVVGSMTLHELVYAYYPDAPVSLLFREHTTLMVVLASLPLAKLAAGNSQIAFTAYMPRNARPPSWTTRPQTDHTVFLNSLPPIKTIPATGNPPQWPQCDSAQLGGDRLTNDLSANVARGKIAQGENLGNSTLNNTNLQRNPRPGRISNYSSYYRSSLSQALPSFNHDFSLGRNIDSARSQLGDRNDINRRGSDSQPSDNTSSLQQSNCSWRHR